MNRNSLIFRTLEFYGTRLNHRGQWLVHEKLRRFFNVNVDEDFEVERKGLRWILNPSDHMHSELFWLGMQDYWDIYQIKKILKPGSVIFDVGANCGYYSITLAHELKGNCEVHAFEPNPPTYERFLKNIELNNLTSIKVHKLGLSDAKGTGDMIERADNSGAAAVNLSESGAGNIALTTLDDFCSDQKISGIDFIKVDIEGFEERFLLGGKESLLQFKPVLLVEFNPSTLIRDNSSVEKLKAILEGYGYSLFVSNKKTLIPLQELPSGNQIVNVFCFHKTRTKN